MDRRDFLKTSALAAGGLLLPRLAGAQAAAEPLFSFLALADPHLSEDRPGEPTGVAKFERTLDVVRALPRKPAFMLLLGDIHPAKLDAFMGRWPVPVRPVAGNHESLEQRRQLRALFPESFAERDFYGFTHEGCRFLGLCTALVGDHVGHLESEDITPKVGQVAWLEEELRQAQGLRGRFLFAHVPPDQDNKPVGDCLGSLEARYLHELMDRQRVTACFFGHRHAYRSWQHGETWCYGVPSLNWNYGGKPTGFLEALVYADRVTVDFVET